MTPMFHSDNAHRLLAPLLVSAVACGNMTGPKARPCPASATRRTNVAVYAAPGGANSGAGTLATPWDLTTALSCALTGDTVWLRGGVYSGAFATALDGSSSAPIL